MDNQRVESCAKFVILTIIGTIVGALIGVIVLVALTLLFFEIDYRRSAASATWERIEQTPENITEILAIEVTDIEADYLSPMIYYATANGSIFKCQETCELTLSEHVPNTIDNGCRNSNPRMYKVSDPPQEGISEFALTICTGLFNQQENYAVAADGTVYKSGFITGSEGTAMMLGVAIYGGAIVGALLGSLSVPVFYAVRNVRGRKRVEHSE
jgi:hypothetical protein